MEPITATLTTVKEIYEAAKTIQKVYNVSKEMKTVAESEGKDQIMATKELADTASTMKQEGIIDKGNSSSKELEIEGDLYYGESDGQHLPNGDFFHHLGPSQIESTKSLDSMEFVDKLSFEETPTRINNQQNVFVDRLSTTESSASALELKSEIPDNLQAELAPKAIEQTTSESNYTIETTKKEKPEKLTEQEKQEIKDKTGWSDKIVHAIRTKEEAQVYIDGGLVEGEINGKPALLQPNIDGKACNESKWPDWNNKDLAEEGYPPRDKNGRPYELHHIGQNPDSPLAELTYEQHHSEGNFKVLHTFEESFIDRVQFNKERKEYWSERSKSL